MACVNLTSGTTGAAKGVLLPPRNLLRNAELFAKYFGLGPSTIAAASCCRSTSG